MWLPWLMNIALGVSVRLTTTLSGKGRRSNGLMLHVWEVCSGHLSEQLAGEGECTEKEKRRYDVDMVF